MRYTAHNAVSTTARRHGLVLRSAKRGAGFTLLEVLVAMTILSIIGAAIFTMFRQSSEMYSRTIAHTRQFLAAREALGLMANELRQARLVPVALPAGVEKHGFWGYEKDVYFVAPTSMRPDGEQDICVIGYWITDDGNPLTPDNLMRYCLTDTDAEWKLLPRPANMSVVSAKSAQLGLLVRKLTFEYWGPTDTEWDPTDSNRLTWESAAKGDTLPRAVRITLVVADPSDPLADPVTGKSNKDKTFTTVVFLDNAG